MPTYRKLGRALLLIWSVLSLGMGMLTLRPAPSEFLLKIKVVATEYGYTVSVIQAVLLFVTKPFRLKTGSVFNLLTSTAIVFSVACTAVPLLRAIFYARDLPERLDEAFAVDPEKRSSRPVLVLSRLPRLWPASLKSVEQMVFSRTEHYELDFDLFRPPRSTPGGDPCIVVVHGGKWTQGDSRRFTSLSPHLAAQGYVVLGINYRKADKYPFPAASDDLRAAITYIKRNAQDLGVDADRIALLGRSAGGQLALLVAYDQYDPSIRGVVSFYGPTDLVYGYYDPTEPRVIDTPETLGIYIRDATDPAIHGTPVTAKAAYDAASPINFVKQSTPPTLLLHGSHDEMVHVVQSDRLSQRLEQFGVEHLYLRLPWATHGFDHNLWGPGGQIGAYAVERFMQRVLQQR